MEKQTEEDYLNGDIEFRKKEDAIFLKGLLIEIPELEVRGISNKGYTKVELFGRTGYVCDNSSGCRTIYFPIRGDNTVYGENIRARKDVAKMLKRIGKNNIEINSNE